MDFTTGSETGAKSVYKDPKSRVDAHTTLDQFDEFTFTTRKLALGR